MPEASFARKVVGPRPGLAEAGEGKHDWRKGFCGDNAGAANPFSLSLRHRDGRACDGFSMSLYARHRWIDQGGPVERLVLLFSNGGVYVEGQHLKREVEALLEEGKLKRIQEHDSAEIAAITAHNLDRRKPEDKEPIVLRIVVSPSVESVLENDENLAEIARAMKGESDETGYARSAER
jgi:hypothetical protein